MSFPVTRPLGRVLIVGNPTFRADPLRALRAQGFECAEANDAYAAMLELCRHRLAYRAMILCIASFYREELHFIASVKRRMPHIEIWLTQTDGRVGALAEAMQLGADGLLAEDGTLHRIGAAASPPEPLSQSTGGTELLSENETFDDVPASLAGASPDARMESSFGSVDSGLIGVEDPSLGEPVLSADELRALLQDQPSMPPSGSGE